jgi:hypothetical protein
MSEASFSVEVEQDEFCCICGADGETDESLVSGFLTIPVVTPQSAVALRRVCDACLSLLLATVLQRAGNGAGSLLARAAIEAEQEELDDPG